MSRFNLLIIVTSLLLAGCGSAAVATPEAAPLPSGTPSPQSSPTHLPTITPFTTVFAATLAAPPAIGIPRIRLADGMEMVYIPAGEFLMGSADDPRASLNEKPQHTVPLEAYWIDRTEVTVASIQGLRGGQRLPDHG